MVDDYRTQCGVYVEQKPVSIYKTTCGNCKRTKTYKSRKKVKPIIEYTRGQEVEVKFKGRIIKRY
jgi:hypothetical protein